MGRSYCALWPYCSDCFKGIFFILLHAIGLKRCGFWFRRLGGVLQANESYFKFMKDGEKIGRVIELLPNTLYKVEFDDAKILICYLSGRMKLNHINVFVGDRVQVLIDQYGGKATNRITKRL